MLSDLAFEVTKPHRPYGVPVQWQPDNPEQPIRWYCFGSRTIHGIEGCEECAGITQALLRQVKKKW